jgi:hypothetical protein
MRASCRICEGGIAERGSAGPQGSLSHLGFDEHPEFGGPTRGSPAGISSIERRGFPTERGLPRPASSAETPGSLVAISSCGPLSSSSVGPSNSSRAAPGYAGTAPSENRLQNGRRCETGSHCPPPQWDRERVGVPRHGGIRQRGSPDRTPAHCRHPIDPAAAAFRQGEARPCREEAARSSLAPCALAGMPADRHPGG